MVGDASVVDMDGPSVTVGRHSTHCSLVALLSVIQGTKKILLRSP